VSSVQRKSAKKSPACRGAEEFICCQGEHGSKGRKRYLIGVSAPSASAGFGRVRPLERLLPGTRPRRAAPSGSAPHVEGLISGSEPTVRPLAFLRIEIIGFALAILTFPR
jgi:hypothetical protein